ncbi:hypothetical protein ERO13_A08G172175v2, partial [Gossypium hirsutum]
MTMHWKGLWILFSFHGRVVDAFIPKKKCKSGKRFGFVRFTNFMDAQRAISRLNGFVILGSRIWIKLAKFKGRRHIWRKREWSYLKEFFISIEPWTKKFMFSERVTWVEISGVPLNCWNYEMFKRVAGIWRNLVSMGENFIKATNYEKMEMMDSINQARKIEEVIFLEVRDNSFPISVKE